MIRSVLFRRDWFAAQWPEPYSRRMVFEAAMHVMAIEAAFPEYAAPTQEAEG